MVMTCCLLIYAALEHKIRQELVAQSAYFPCLKYKPCQNPTARWIFFCFQGIHVLNVNKERQLALNIEDRKRVLIDCMGEYLPAVLFLKVMRNVGCTQAICFVLGVFCFKTTYFIRAFVS